MAAGIAPPTANPVAMKRLLSLVVASALIAPLAARAEDSTGVTDTKITIGIHIPLTGAAPIHPEVADAGKDLYWRWLKSRGGSINGRDVEVLLANDGGSNPTAGYVCNDMADKRGAFLVVCFSDTDPINACSGTLERIGVPYLSPGVQEAELEDRSTYFALSATFPAQMRITAEYVLNVRGPSAERYEPMGEPPPPPWFRIPILGIAIPKEPEGEPPPPNAIDVGLVRPNTPNYNDAQRALADGLDAEGIRLHVYAATKEGHPDQMRQFVSQMRPDGIDAVFDMMGRSQTVALAERMDEMGYRPHFLGPSMRAGVDSLLQNACDGPDSALHEASFFTAWPAFSDAAAFDPDLVDAARELAPGIDSTSTDRDFLFALWGLMKVVAGMLDAAGPTPTREGFLAAMDAGYAGATGVWAPVSVSSSNHFGVDAVHRIEADCVTDQAFHEREAFVTGYDTE